MAALAVAMARVAAPVARERVELAAEPVHAGQVWANPVVIDPFLVPDSEVLALLESRSAALLASAHVQRVDAGLPRLPRHHLLRRQRRARTRCSSARGSPAMCAAFHITDERFDDMSSCAPPAARGWEYLVGDGAWDWDAELAALPELLAEKSVAPSVEPGRYDLVIDPTNLWLTIHESVGHATELDRALGLRGQLRRHVASPRCDQLGTLQYGSPLMHVTGDRTVAHGLATIGYDDEGVAAQSWDLVRDGTLVGYQLDRRMAAEHGFGRSNGCAFADSAGARARSSGWPTCRLQPRPDGARPRRADRRGRATASTSSATSPGRSTCSATTSSSPGSGSSGSRSGRLVGQVRDVAYQATTTDFWAALEALGGPQTYLLGGAFNCGKAQPGQVAPVSHGCPVAVFEGINVLNTQREAHA